MAQIFGKKLSREDIRKYFGSLNQLAGIRRFSYDEGKAKGLSAIEVRTGSGLRFIVLPDRGLDIGLTEYKGIPVSFQAAVGETGPHLFDPEGDEWLRSFGGGLLVTCGLTNVGAPGLDEGEKLGLHGRISNLPAEEIAIEKRWEEDECIFKIKGLVREAKTLSYNLVLERQIITVLGEKRLFIRDMVRNEGFKSTPQMLLYHFNLGYPILDEGSKFITDSEAIKPRDEIAAKGIDNYSIYEQPTKNYPEKVFYHKLKSDKKGWSKAALFNETLKIGLYISYENKNLPHFVQWKNTAAGNYVTGLEPANCLVGGRAKERDRNNLLYLQPGEEREYNLEVGILSTGEELNKFKTGLL